MQDRSKALPPSDFLQANQCTCTWGSSFGEAESFKKGNLR